jgi:hypothetical protein
VLVGGVVDDKLGDHPHAAAMRLGDEGFELLHVAVGRVDRLIIGDVVAVVLER